LVLTGRVDLSQFLNFGKKIRFRRDVFAGQEGWLLSGMLRSITRHEVANLILCSLADAALEELWPRLHLLELSRGRSVFAAGAPLEHVYFINRGLISLIRTMRDGRIAEIGAIGV